MNFSSFEENEWKMSLDKDDITIYTRDIESSKFHEFLAVATMQGTIEGFSEIITGVDKYTEWMPDCESAEILENPNPNDVTYHMKLKVPFPFADREIIQQIVLHKKNDLLEIAILNHPDKIDQTKKYVRITIAHGRWIIKQISSEEISIRFQYFADPGGDIPAWLVNSFIVKNPHLTLLNIKEMLAK